jgi:antitoxin (DNA-binding transcriptional repressor) of toxin-antitoxin stability system
MSEAMPIKNAECNLEELLKGLSFGESITLTGPEGGPVALLVSLKPGRIVPRSDIDWDARMDDLARKVSCAWKGEKSAVDILSEMRRL